MDGGRGETGSEPEAEMPKSAVTQPVTTGTWAAGSREQPGGRNGQTQQQRVVGASPEQGWVTGNLVLNVSCPTRDW